MKGLPSSQGSIGTERSTFRLAHVVDDRLHVPVGHYRVGLSSPLLLGGPGLLMMWELISLNARYTETGRDQERCVTGHGSSISQKWHPITNYCDILLIRGEPVNPAHSHKEGITQACEYQERRKSLETVLELAWDIIASLDEDVMLFHVSIFLSLRVVSTLRAGQDYILLDTVPILMPARSWDRAHSPVPVPHIELLSWDRHQHGAPGPVNRHGE